ncbi:VOC family protein [Microlunatus flavus]|uniref:Catechol 2,3-dioxygenase n=1 Tax=Microlunatus flavus TaxID=1036181 RepID=A0A1H9J637_9ACTN|nr:VOC family protein [Microlunatus flavus]SEQ82242.1 Catechol 2,3-dioxygenase [Microlunatus flavus]
MSDPGRPALAGVHHLKLAVSDLAASLEFYERALGAVRIPAADHRRTADGSLYAVLCQVEGLGPLLELRLDPARARAHRGFDPVTVAVPDRAALEAWTAYLDAHDVPHSGVVTAIRSWLVAFDDPDGNRMRLYSLEEHGPELAPDETNPWVAGQDPAEQPRP